MRWLPAGMVLLVPLQPEVSHTDVSQGLRATLQPTDHEPRSTRSMGVRVRLFLYLALDAPAIDDEGPSDLHVTGSKRGATAAVHGSFPFEQVGFSSFSLPATFHASRTNAMSLLTSISTVSGRPGQRTQQVAGTRTHTPHSLTHSLHTTPHSASRRPSSTLTTVVPPGTGDGTDTERSESS